MENKVELDGTEYPLDFRGYLANFSLWSTQLMAWFAEQEQVEMTDDHIEVIHSLRSYYSKNKIHPVVRIVVVHMTQVLGENKGTIPFFHTLFPRGVHQAYRIAGLPLFVQSV